MLWLHTVAGKALGWVCTPAGCPGLLPGGAAAAPSAAGHWDGESIPAEPALVSRENIVREAKLRHQQRSTCTIQPAPTEDHSLHTAPSAGVITGPSPSDTSQHLLSTFRRPAWKTKGGGGGLHPSQIHNEKQSPQMAALASTSITQAGNLPGVKRGRKQGREKGAQTSELPGLPHGSNRMGTTRRPPATERVRPGRGAHRAAPRARGGGRHLRVLGVVLASGVVVVDSWKGDKVQDGAESWT